MSTMIQIRNVPDGIHRTLKARAALAGQSLSDYLLTEISRRAEQPTLQEISQRLEALSDARLSISPEDAVRELRDSR